MRAKHKVALAVELSIYSENKGADQLRGLHAVDLRLCFRICKKECFVMTTLVMFMPQVAWRLYRYVHSVD